MKLISFKYKNASWKLKKLQFKDVNLIVGTNSSGKSRTLDFLFSLNKIIVFQLESLVKWNSKWELIFQTAENQTLNYSIELIIDKNLGYFNDAKLIKETISIDDDVVLERNEQDKAKIKSSVTNEWEELFPPNTKLVLHTRRDTKHFPFLENIVVWVEQLQLFKFGDISSLSLSDHYRKMPELFHSLTPEQQSKIKKELNDIGYGIEKFESAYISSIVAEQSHYRLDLQEEGVKNPLNFYELSQGMSRALSILVFIESQLNKKTISTLLIDDFCEGLDYSKATKLGKLVFDKCKNSNIQLITTSNDGFLMDTIDLKYWHVLKREGSIVKSISIDTHPEIFEKFKFTGLSNFDFFSSDFLKQNESKA